MVYLTRRKRFNAAHKLYLDGLNLNENFAKFGKCSNPNWHEHNYQLFVTVKGIPDKKTGFVTNARNLSQIIEEYVISKLDHKNINLDVDFFPKELQPTTEI